MRFLPKMAHDLLVNGCYNAIDNAATICDFFCIVRVNELGIHDMTRRCNEAADGKLLRGESCSAAR